MEHPDIHISFTPQYNVNPGDEDFESDMFEFDVEAIFTHLHDQDDDGDEDSDVLHYSNDQIPSTIRRVTFLVERRVDDDSFRENIRCRLEGLGFPGFMHLFLVNRILHEAESLQRDKAFLGSKVIRMGISIEVPVNNHDEALNLDSDDFFDAKLVPASKSSIESLERVNVVEGSNTQCSVCFEEISAEATRLPCSHVYHAQCISSWLEKSGKCPLCRFVI